MSHSKLLDAYPMAWMRLAQEGGMAQRPIRTECADPKAARALRMRWYGFLRALDANPNTVEAAKSARRLLVRVEGSTLLHVPRHCTKEDQAIMTADDDLTLALQEADAMIQPFDQ